MLKISSLENWLTHLANVRIKCNPEDQLQNIKKVALNMGILPITVPTILVGGTNGKGSTVTALTSIYYRAKYKVGTYTSPHILKYNERITINRSPCFDESIIDAFNLIESQREDILLTEFEFLTLAGLLIFKRANVDLIILEVGCGGRFDATNIVTAHLSIITSISYDHCDILGNTLDEIADQKAGIIKRGQLVICGMKRISPAIQKIVEKKKASLYQLGIHFDYERYRNNWRIRGSDLDVVCRLPQGLRIDNIALASYATHLLQDRLKVSRSIIIEGIENITINGRCQLMNIQGIPLLLDVSHNSSSADYLAYFIKKLKIKSNCIGVFAVMNDKDITNILKPLIGIVNKWCLCETAHLKIASTISIQKILRRHLQVKDKDILIFNRPHLAIKSIITQLSIHDLIVVFGSFTTVEDILANYNFAFSNANLG